MNDLDFSDVNKSYFGGALVLKKSLFKLKTPSILCEIDPKKPYFLKIIYYNNLFLKEFDLSQEEILGKNYDFLFEDIDFSYSENHLEYVKLIKAVKDFKQVEANIDIGKLTDKKNTKNYKISFQPNNFKNEYLYSIITFKENFIAKDDLDKQNSSDNERLNSFIQSLERKLRNERVLRLISEIIVSDIPLKQIADKISKLLCDYLRVSRCILYDYKEGETGFISESHDQNTKSMIGDGVDDKVDLNPIRRYINFQNHLFKDFNVNKNSNTSLVCKDTHNDSRFKIINDVCRDFKIASQISIFTTFNGEINGGLFLHQPNVSNWFLEEIKFLEIVADQFSIAIDRSHSLDRVMYANSKLLDKTIQLRKSLKQEKNMRKMQSEFVAMVSHEFKTPLQIIDGTREVISRKFKAFASSDDSINKFLDKIKNGVKRMNGLIDSNLNLSKIEIQQDKIKLNKSSFSIKEMLLEIIDRSSNLSENKNIKFVCDIEKISNPFYGDKKMLDHSIGNIITNAIKYSKENSEVSIEGKIDEKNLVIEISDQGIGIPEQDIANIGKKFFRAKNTLAVPGTGIGIYLTKYFIELHKGSVLIESQINKGSKFTILLPI